jgi:hypothetical protein
MSGHGRDKDFLMGIIIQYPHKNIGIVSGRAGRMRAFKLQQILPGGRIMVPAGSSCLPMQIFFSFKQD